MSELFRLGSIFLYLRLHGTYSGCPLQRLTCRPRCHPATRQAASFTFISQADVRGVCWVQESAFGNKSSLKAKPKTDHDLLLNGAQRVMRAPI
jgi:hypothetical protein